MKLTIIGNCNSVYISQLVEQIRKSSLFDNICGLMFEKYNKGADTKFDDIKFPNVPVVKNRILKLFIKGLKYLIIKKKIKEMGELDIANIHFLYYFLPYFWTDIKKRSKKTIVTIWGGDFDRADTHTRKKLKKIIKECDAIVFGNEQTAKKFTNFYYDLSLTNKIYIRRFGLKPLDFIREINLSNEEAKKELDLPVNKIVVTVGYSSTPGHLHKEIIKHINKLDPLVLKQLIFVFPMTYGDFEYRDDIEVILRTVGFNYIVLKNFMTYEGIAKLRIASDIMVNLQITDQFSGSMQESFYAGNVVITGSWLPYDILWNYGVFGLKVESLDEFNNKLIYTVNNLKELKDKSKNNKKIIWELSSWEKNSSEWLNMYKDIIKK